MSKEVDLARRDPNSLNTTLQVDFEEVFGEPDHTHSMDCVWRNSYKCFTCTKNNCYKVLTFLCGILTAFCWACNFACSSFCIIWCCTPYLRCLSICCHPLKKCSGIVYYASYGICCEICGLCFSRIHVTNSQGQPPKPLDSIDNNQQVKKF